MISQKISLTFVLQMFLRLTSQNQTQPLLFHILTICLHLPTSFTPAGLCKVSKWLSESQIHIQTTKNRRPFSKDVIRVWNDMRVSKKTYFFYVELFLTVLWHQAVKHFYSQPLFLRVCECFSLTLTASSISEQLVSGGTGAVVRSRDVYTGVATQRPSTVSLIHLTFIHIWTQHVITGVDLTRDRDRKKIRQENKTGLKAHLKENVLLTTHIVYKCRKYTTHSVGKKIIKVVCFV